MDIYKGINKNADDKTINVGRISGGALFAGYHGTTGGIDQPFNLYMNIRGRKEPQYLSRVHY
jgi:hypothetical protein